MMRMNVPYIWLPLWHDEMHFVYKETINCFENWWRKKQLQNCILYLLGSAELFDSRPSELPRLKPPAPYIRNLDGVGRELAEFSLKVDAESLSPLPLLPLLTLGVDFLRLAELPPLSLSLPYSPSFLGGWIIDLAGDALLELAFEDRESAPLEFLRWGSLLSNRLYSPILRGSPERCEERGGRGKELGDGQTFDPSWFLSLVSAMRCFCDDRPCFSNSIISPFSWRFDEVKNVEEPAVNGVWPPFETVTLANSGLGSFPFLCAEIGLASPGKQHRPRCKDGETGFLSVLWGSGRVSRHRNLDFWSGFYMRVNWKNRKSNSKLFRRGNTMMLSSSSSSIWGWISAPFVFVIRAA